ncbi:MAG: Spo0E family sporulation regulatory protein-aspartic acid phosphatase [Clostridia bacterium]
MKYKERKYEIAELQNCLNSIVTQSNLCNGVTLDISKKLDSLILEYCTEELKNRDEKKCSL